MKPIKPQIKVKKITVYPQLKLEPEQKMGWDGLELEFKEDHILIHAYIDGCGNDFKLFYKQIEEYLEVE